MIIIRFPDNKAKRRALGFLPGRFSIKSWATGEMMVPENYLPFLAVEGIPFSVEGPANYERLAALRDSAAVPAQRRAADSAGPLNPKGIPPQSPGLRGTSYPG
jgi:hypothetical protein